MSQSQPPLIHTARHHDRDHAALLQRGRFDKALEAAKALAPYFSQKFAPTDQPAVPHLEQGLPLFANQPNAGRSAPGQKGTRPPRRRARRRGNRMGRCRAHPRPPSAALRVIGRLISNDRHIRVNTLSPGPPTTPGLVGLAGDARRRNGLLDHLASVGRLAGLLIRTRSANAALFLASDNSRFVIGAELFDEGGKPQV
jgi:Enoyl-(Acyl carrier protein) reductase